MCFFKKEPKPLWLLLKLSSTLCRDLKTNKKCWYYYYCCYDETKTWQTNIHTYLESFMLLEMHTLYMIIYTTLKLLRMTSILIFSLYLYLLALLLFLFTFFTRQKKTTLRDPLLMMALLLCNALGKKRHYYTFVRIWLLLKHFFLLLYLLKKKHIQQKTNFSALEKKGGKENMTTEILRYMTKQLRSQSLFLIQSTS